MTLGETLCPTRYKSKPPPPQPQLRLCKMDYFLNFYLCRGAKKKKKKSFYLPGEFLFWKWRGREKKKNFDGPKVSVGQEHGRRLKGNPNFLCIYLDTKSPFGLYIRPTSFFFGRSRIQVDNTGKVVLSKTVFFVVVCTQKPLYFCEQQQLPKGTGRFCFSPSYLFLIFSLRSGLREQCRAVGEDKRALISIIQMKWRWANRKKKQNQIK